MLAALLERFGTPLTITEVEDPQIGTGEVLVDVLATCIPPYAAEVFSGARRYPLEPPVISGVGAIGRVVRTGPDATRLHPGDLVWCDATVRSRDDAAAPDITLQGWSSAGEGGLTLSRYFHDGPFAQRMRVPTENAVALGDVDLADVARWSALGILLVPYGGLLAADLQAGETVVVSGATGNFGSAGVAVALAMGAACVVCPGRNAAVLRDLESRFGKRIRTVTLTGDGEADRAAIQAAAPAAVDVVLDLLPPSAGTGPVRAAALTVRPYGRIVLMGGVGMLGGDDLALPYPWLMRNSVTVRGQWMYPRMANHQLIAMIRSGVLDLSHEAVTVFPLTAANEAVEHAAAHGLPFQRTVLAPSGDLAGEAQT
ncbi:alcohol dehydrogenase [Mycolicibacterium madagascariense]|uniref:Alcohol dehydrogenase n=1 Tax=Mycolicibacterium madagascariense TaxID=212765 RepID=A0A7I7XEH6_9MYCO|nr:zinc-binding alcohol dehydrogenase family protein [Mycolicibacterium madagascariense]MCV7015198.1 zinc-binding alcohol dehydrogenase family protein [Mycolicibacterium madagascariense]BBZ27491.1 alcohol dehydrogenase [Mycolicibacterium madagascariense]